MKLIDPYRFASAFGGSSWDFDGVNEYINYGTFQAFGNSVTDSPFSVSVWVYMHDATSFRILSKTSASNREFLIATSGSDRLFFQCYDNVSSVRIGRQYNTAITSYQNTWAHFCFTYSGNSANSGIKIYIDGVRVDDINASAGSYTAMHDTGVNLSFAAFVSASNSYANGYMTDLAIYDIELNLTQIGNIYNSGTPIDLRKESNPSDSNLLLYSGAWDCSDGAGGITDLSGNGNDGSFVNMSVAGNVISSYPP